MNCDFCGDEVTKEDLTMLPVDRFNIPELNYWNFSWAWGGCPSCTVLLKDGDMKALLDRAVAHHPETEAVRPLLELIYDELMANQNGPFRGWLPEDDEDKET